MMSCRVVHDSQPGGKGVYTMSNWLRNNGLSLAFIGFFFFSLAGQIATGKAAYNSDLEKKGQSRVGLTTYLQSGHFIEATFENWESEFLQMALFVLLTIGLRQKGSSESKSLNGEDEVDRKPDPARKDAPWPVKKGGWIGRIYNNSLTIALLLLFALSFCFHLWGSWLDENEQLALEKQPPIGLFSYLIRARFWFESFQNWQSEFLSVFAIIVLSIFLRQKGSSQSKPVDAPHTQTG